MPTFEFPREAWVHRLNAFTTIHEGWLVSLDVLAPEIAQLEIDNLALLGVSADRVDHDGAIAVSVARSATEHLTHIIHAVTQIDVEHTDEGAAAALRSSRSTARTRIVRFRAAALPETMDGVVHR